MSYEHLPKFNSIIYTSVTWQFLLPFYLSSVSLQHATILPPALLLIQFLLLVLIQELPLSPRALSHLYTWQLAEEDRPLRQLLPTQHGGGPRVSQCTVTDLTRPINPPIPQFENPNYPLHFDELGPICRRTPLKEPYSWSLPQALPSRKAPTLWNGC